MSQFPLVLDPSNTLGLLVVPQTTSGSHHLPYPQTWWNSVPYHTGTHPHLNRRFSTGGVAHTQYIPHEHFDKHAMSFMQRDRPFKVTRVSDKITFPLHPDTTPPPPP